MWIIVISTCSAVTIIVVLVLCSCWKRKRQKDDWLGLDGMVTQKNPDENVNHLPSAAIEIDTPSIVVTNDDNENNKRPLAASNTRRSLPDIPSEGQPRAGVWDPNGDNSSELYATVEPYHNTKRHTLPNGIDSRPSISQHSSISQADDAFSPYASVNYDKLNKVEHPYAIVKPPLSSESIDNAEEPTVRTLLLSPGGPSTSTAVEPNPPPRSRRDSTQSNLGVDINAATAVAGGIAASQELPYMTPPIDFSGDSQDSSKGYTSIVVREPLAVIQARTKEMNKTKRSLDPHYSTVSDDSDEVYTTIPDPNQEYTSGSETYAQIQPVALTVSAEINPVPSIINETSDIIDNYTPQPPSVDSLRYVSNSSHSRQASSCSSILNLGSPKPEKRQANSPLPPPPSTTSPDLLTPEKHKLLDDMYAKVHKTRKKTEEPEKEILPRKSASTSSSSETVDTTKPEIIREHNYETLKKSPRKNSDAGYEKLKLKDDPGYASINGPDSISTDPGYEVLNKRSGSDVDPNYEQLCGYSTINETNKKSVSAGYSVVNKQHKLNLKQLQKELAFDEPNYESMPSEVDGSETDPNYESVNQSDPNYESVKYLDVGYERLNTDDESSRTDSSSKKNSGYETVDSSESVDKIKTPYQKLNEEDNSKTDSESSGYEKIEKSNDYETIKDSNTAGNSVSDDEEIFQV